MKKITWFLVLFMCFTLFENVYFEKEQGYKKSEYADEYYGLWKKQYTERYDLELKKMIPLTEEQIAFNERIDRLEEEMEVVYNEMKATNKLLNNLLFIHALPILIALNVHFFSLLKEHQFSKVLKWFFLSMYLLIFGLSVFLGFAFETYRVAILAFVFLFTSASFIFTMTTILSRNIPKVLLHFFIVGVICFCPLLFIFF